MEASRKELVELGLDPILIPFVERVGEPRNQFRGGGRHFIIFDFSRDLKIVERHRGAEDTKMGDGITKEAREWLESLNAERRFSGRVLDYDPFPEEDLDEDDPSNFQFAPVKLYDYITAAGEVYQEDLQAFRILDNNGYYYFLTIRKKGQEGWVAETVVPESTIESYSVMGNLW